MRLGQLMADLRLGLSTVSDTVLGVEEAAGPTVDTATAFTAAETAPQRPDQAP